MPVRATVCGLPLALSVMFSVPVRLPAAPGVNATWIVVLPPGATVIGRVTAPRLKSAAFVPLMAKLETVRFSVPALLMVIGCAAVVVFNG